MSITEQIWHDYYEKLQNFVKGKINDSAAADDILQEVFLKMHRNLYSLKEEAKLQSWLYQITRNTIIDYYRQQKPTEILPEWLSQPESDSTFQARQELSECMLPLIEKLPAHYRTAITLSEIQGMTQNAVSQQQGISLSGAKSRIQRGRILLREMLQECCQLKFGYTGKVIDYQKKSESDACGTCETTEDK